MTLSHTEHGRWKCASCGTGMHEFSQNNNGLGGYFECPGCHVEASKDYLRGYWDGRDIRHETLSFDLHGATDDSMQTIGLRVESDAIKILGENEMCRFEIVDGKLVLRYWLPGNDQEAKTLELEEPADRTEWQGDCDYCLAFDTNVHRDLVEAIECDHCEEHGHPEWEFYASGPNTGISKTFDGYKSYYDAEESKDRLKENGYYNFSAITQTEEVEHPRICDFCAIDDGREVEVDYEGLLACKECMGSVK